MKPNNRTIRKGRPVRVMFNDIENLQVVLPPQMQRLPVNLTLVFENGKLRIGFTEPGLKFHASMDEVKRLGQIPMIVNAIKPSDGTRQAATLVASLAPETDPKFAPEVGGALIQVSQFLKNLDDLKTVIEERPKVGFMHKEAEATLLDIIPILKGFIRQTVETASKRKKFSDILEEHYFPKDVANRLIGGSVNFAQNDLIRAFYPSDPSKHLSFSLREIKAGAHKAFSRVLTLPAQRTIMFFASPKMEDYLSNFNSELKVSEFRVQMPCPLPIKDLFKARNRRFMGPTGNEAYRVLWTLNSVFTYPQWITTGGLHYTAKQLAVDMLKVQPEALPTDMKGWEDILPEGKCPHVEFIESDNFKKMFHSFDLGPWVARYEEAISADIKFADYNPPKAEDYKITIDKKKIVKTKVRIPTIQTGPFRLGETAKDLLNEIKKVNPPMVAVVRSYLTNFQDQLQNSAANMIFARLEAGVDYEVPAFADAPGDIPPDEEVEIDQ